MNEHTTKKRVVEVRRFRFRSYVDLRPMLKDVRINALPGGEFLIRPSDYLRAVHQLSKNPKIELVTARDIQNELGWIHYREVRSNPRWVPVDHPDNWTYLSPIVRRWRRCPVNNGRILARQGWVLTHHRERGRPSFYFFEDDKSIEECQLAGDKAIRRAYEGVLGTLPVPYWADGTLLSAIWPGYVIPKEHESFLTGTMLPMDNLITSDEGNSLWIWHPSDKEIIEDTLHGLHLRLVPWDPGENWIETVSTIMKRAYGVYFQRREGAEELKIIIRQRAWNLIKDSILQGIIRQLCQSEWEGNNAASALLNFIANRLCIDLDWKVHGEELEGWVIESSPIIYGQHVLPQRYYRVVIPQFETVLGWQTRRHPDWEGENRPKVRIYHWRSSPFTGRLKTGGGQSRDPIPGKASRDLRDRSLRSMLGIPTIEWQLASELAVGAFVLDLDGAHWKGCHDLCRYFSSYGRAISLNPAECDGYGLLLEDALGQRFVLETHALDINQLPDRGDWIQFVAHSSLLRHQSWMRLKRNVPVFDISMPQMFRRAYERDALRNSLLALVKYNFGITRKDIHQLFNRNWQTERVEEAIQFLIEDDEILVHSDCIYYRYNMLTVQEMTDLLLVDDNSKDKQIFYNLRTLLHPLYVRTLNLTEITQPMTPDQIQKMRTLYVSSRFVYGELLRMILENLANSGSGKIAARGKQVLRAQKLVKDLLVENPQLKVRRWDDVHTFEDGHQVDEVEYLVRDLLRELQIRFG